MDPHIAIDDDDDGTHNLQGASGGGYVWEEEYKRSWDVLKEDDQGSLQTLVGALQQQLRRRKLQRNAQPVQRVIIRHLYVVVDLSEAMEDLDLKPSRMELTFGFLDQFVQEFFDQNPLSQIGIIVTRNGLASEITELSAVPTDHLTALADLKLKKPRGEPSLQNALRLAMASLTHMAAHASREVLVIHSALTTADPGDIFETIDELVSNRIRVSIVGLSAELHICKLICDRTQGIYNVVLNENHYKDIFFEHIPPPPIVHQTESQITKMLRMGFPAGKRYPGKGVLCSCHAKPINRGYICPTCSSIVCQLPINCPLCSLTLVSSPLLARLYHHLFPVPNFPELGLAKIQSTLQSLADYAKLTLSCFGCLSAFQTPIPIPLNVANDVNQQNEKTISKLVEEKIQATVIRVDRSNRAEEPRVEIPINDSDLEKPVKADDIDIKLTVKKEKSTPVKSTKLKLSLQSKTYPKKEETDSNDNKVEPVKTAPPVVKKRKSSMITSDDDDDDIAPVRKKTFTKKTVKTFDDLFSDDDDEDIQQNGSRENDVPKDIPQKSIEIKEDIIELDSPQKVKSTPRKAAILDDEDDDDDDIGGAEHLPVPPLQESKFDKDMDDDARENMKQLELLMDDDSNNVNDSNGDEEFVETDAREIVKQAFLRSLKIQSGGSIDGVSIPIHIAQDAAEAAKMDNVNGPTSAGLDNNHINPFGMTDDGERDFLYVGDKPSGRYICPTCKNHFCFECDVFIHDVLHNCPGCESTGLR